MKTNIRENGCREATRHLREEHECTTIEEHECKTIEEHHMQVA